MNCQFSFRKFNNKSGNEQNMIEKNLGKDLGAPLYLCALLILRVHGRTMPYWHAYCDVSVKPHGWTSCPHGR